MKRSTTSFGWVVCCISFITVAWAVEPTTMSAMPGERSSGQHTITSHHKNFIVSGLPKGDALQLAVWAEEVRQKLEAWVQSSMPVKQVYPMIIMAKEQSSSGQGQVLKAQAYSADGYLRQELTLLNPDLLTREHVLEGLCSLLLNRWIPSQNPTASRERKALYFPDWFTAGVAQQLYPELVQRSDRLIRDAERAGEYEAASTVLEAIYMPSGQWRDKAMAGLVVAWLAEELSSATLMSIMVEQAKRSQGWNPSFLWPALGVKHARSMNMRWDLWMAQKSKRFIPGEVELNRDAVDRLLEMRADDTGLIHPAAIVNGRMDVDVLIRERKEPWAGEVAASLANQLRQLTMGSPPDVMPGLADVLAFYDAIALPHYVKAAKKKQPSNRELKALWERGIRLWSADRERTRTTQSFMDAFSERIRLEPEASPDDVHTLLDRWEKVTSPESP